MLEDEGLVMREQVSSIPRHVEYSLTDKGRELTPVIAELSEWSQRWICSEEEPFAEGQLKAAKEGLNHG